MDEFISVSPIPGSNGFDNRMVMPCHSPNTMPHGSDFTEKSGNYLSTLMEGDSVMMISDNTQDLQANFHQAEKCSVPEGMDLLDSTQLHSFLGSDQNNVMYDQQKPFQVSNIPGDNEPHTIGNCDNCGGLMRKKINAMSQLQRFCSDDCAKMLNSGMGDRSGNEMKTAGSEVVPVNDEKQPMQINWDKYFRNCQNKMAPAFFFSVNTYITIDVPGLNPGMKLEAIDKNNPQSFCVATVVQIVGNRLRIRYDGYGKDSSNDLWCNFQAEELHPIGWCAQNGFPLQPPTGISCTLEEWRTFLTKTLTGALAAPKELFRKEHFQPRVHGFKVGMKLEVIHPSKPSVLCPGTVVKSLGPYYFLVATDCIQELPTVTFCCHSDSNGIFPAGWSLKHGLELTLPSNYGKKPFSWENYMASCHATFAPPQLFKKTRAHKFKPGFKLEAVDKEEPSVIRMSTVANVMGRVLQIFFDGQSKFQFVETDSPDIYPVGWCKKTGHPLHTAFGKVPFKTLIKNNGSEYEDKLKLISFSDVINRKKTPAKTVVPTSPAPLAPIQKKPVLLSATVKPEEGREEKSEKSQPLSPSDDDDDISDDEGNGTGSERFYHNKNQIYFNKSCCCGPLLNPEEVKQLPDATEPGKVSTVIRAGLEKVAKCAKDPEKVMDMMQEGSGVRVVLKHKGKVLKKAISRVDSRPKLERYLKRFCRRLVCCEYFLSLTPVPSPCPDKCQADEHGNLQGPKGLKAKRSREYFEAKHLGYEKKKRGRKSKSDLAGEAAAQRAAAGIVTTVFHKGDRVPLPNLDLPVTAIADHLRNTATKLLSQNARPTSENLILPKPVLSSTTILTHTNPPVSITNNVPTSTTAVANFGKRPLLPSPCLPTSSVTPPEPQVTKSAKYAGPIKNAVIGRPRGETFQSLPTLPRSKIVQRPLSPNPNAPHGGTITYNLAVKPNAKQPILPQTTTAEKLNVVPCTNSKPPFRLAPPKFTAPPVPSSANPSNQSTFSPRLLAVRQPIGRGGNYRFALPPRPRITNTKTTMVTTRQPLQTSTPLARLGPPPLIPARSFSGRPITSQGIPIMKVKPQESVEKKVVTAAPNVCVTERGTFVSTQVSKATVSTSAANPIIGQSPDANAMMNKMFSVVKYSENGTVVTQVPASVANSDNVSSRVTASKAQETKASSKSSQNGPAGHKFSLNVGGGMGAVTTAVRSGLVTKEEYRRSSGFPRDISEKTITQGGGFSIKINDNSLESNATASEGVPKEHEVNGDGEGKTEVESGTLNKRALWLHRRRKKKKARFTYVKGKARKKKEEEMFAQIMNGNYQDNSNKIDSERIGENIENDELSSMAAEPCKHDCSKDEDKEGKRRGRPPKRPFPEGEDVEDDKDPPFIPPREAHSGPKRFQRPASSFASSTEMHQRYPNLIATSGSTQQGLPRQQIMVTHGNSSDLSSTATTTVTSTCITSPKAELMKGVHHAVQSSQHPSMLRSPLGKQSHTMSGFCSSPPKRSRLLSSGSPTSKKTRDALYSSCPKSSNSFSRTSIKRPPTYAEIGTNTSLPGCPSNVCIYHPANPNKWTIEQVAEYVRATDCKNYATLFMDQEIDGESLLLLTRNALMQFTNMKLGPTLKMSNYIAQLRARAGLSSYT